MGIPQYLRKMNVHLFCNFDDPKKNLRLLASFASQKKDPWTEYAKKLKRIFREIQAPFCSYFYFILHFSILSTPSQKKSNKRRRE